MDGVGENTIPNRDIRQYIIKYATRTWHGNCLSSMIDIDALKFILFKGTSMMPGLKQGDILVVSPIQGIHPETGEIVLRKREDKTFVAHRVIGFDKKTATVCTRGDSCLFRDKIWHLGQNSGHVIAIWRNNSFLSVPEGPSFLKRYLAIARLHFKGLKRRLSYIQRYMIKAFKCKFGLLIDQSARKC